MTYKKTGFIAKEGKQRHVKNIKVSRHQCPNINCTGPEKSTNYTIIIPRSGFIECRCCGTTWLTDDESID